VWRSLADRVAGLGGLTVRAHCPSRYYPPPQPPAQLSPILTELGAAQVSLPTQSWP